MNGWAIVELMGHIRYVGPLEEVEFLGTKFGKVADLQSDGTFEEHLFSPASVYQISPVSEEAARARIIYTPALPETTGDIEAYVPDWAEDLR